MREGGTRVEDRDGPGSGESRVGLVDLSGGTAPCRSDAESHRGDRPRLKEIVPERAAASVDPTEAWVTRTRTVRRRGCCRGVNSSRRRTSGSPNRETLTRNAIAVRPSVSEQLLESAAMSSLVRGIAVGVVLVDDLPHPCVVGIVG